MVQRVNAVNLLHIFQMELDQKETKTEIKHERNQEKKKKKFRKKEEEKHGKKPKMRQREYKGWRKRRKQKKDGKDRRSREGKVDRGKIQHFDNDVKKYRLARQKFLLFFSFLPFPY